MSATACFAYDDDNADPRHTHVRDAHANASVVSLAGLAVAHPELMEHLSSLLLIDTAVIPPNGPLISVRFTMIRGGTLTSDEAAMVAYLDDIYNAPDELTLKARRGVILEQIVLQTIRQRVKHPAKDTVVDNAKNITLGASGAIIDTYSVDVAACFSSLKRTEFYSCKLQAKYMEEWAMHKLMKLRRAFGLSSMPSSVGVCCMQRATVIRAVTQEFYSRKFPEVRLYTAEMIASLG